MTGEQTAAGEGAGLSSACPGRPIGYNVLHHKIKVVTLKE
jgi:hypothetical protein